MIPFTCGCGHQGETDDWRAGQRMPCPGCGAMLKIAGGADPLASGTGEPSTSVDLTFNRRDGPEVDRRRDLATEADVRAIAVWYWVLGLFYMILGGFFLAIPFEEIAARRGIQIEGTSAALRLVMGSMFALGVAEITIGQFLFTYHDWARWAAIVFGVANVMFTLFRALGSGAGGWSDALVTILWSVTVVAMLARPQTGAVFTAAYRRVVEANSDIPVPWARSPYFRAPFVLFGLGLLLSCGVCLFGGVGRR